MSDEFQTYKGWQLPADIDVPEERFYKISFGKRETWVLDWYGHVLMIRQLDLHSIDVDIVDSGVDPDGVYYAAAKVTVEVDGRTYSAVGGADATSQQVRDPEHTWSVAESRALKRAVKKALPMLKVQGPAPDQDETGDVDPAESSREIPPPASPPEDDDSAPTPAPEPDPVPEGDGRAW